MCYMYLWGFFGGMDNEYFSEINILNWSGKQTNKQMP